jgi:hypothetical protein
MAIGFSAPAATRSVLLAWDPSPDPDVVGYLVHQGTASGIYGVTSDAGNQTDSTVENLVDGTNYYFVVTAYNASGLESDPSAEVSYRVAAPAPIPISPVVTWPLPSDLVYGTPLSAAQLNAAANVPGTFSYTPSPGTVLPAGPAQALSVTFTPADTTNYTVCSQSVPLNVLRAPLTISAKDLSKAYGAAVPAVGGNYSGFVNNDSAASLAAPVSLTTAATAASHVGTYPITPAGAASPNYSIIFVNGSLTVAPANLTISADNKSMAQGTTVPSLTATYTGWVNGDTPACLATPVVLATTASSNSPAGAYPVSATGAASPDYSITFVNGLLTVTGLPAPWQTADIGSVGLAGSATESGGAYTVKGAGKIASTADSFRFVYQTLSGDGEIKLQITSAQNTGTGGRIGVMIRESLTSKSKYAFMGVSPGCTFRWQRRSGTGGSTSSTTSGSVTLPNAWVRLVRTGNALSGYKSTDGVTWKQVTSSSITMAANIYVGLAVASGSTTALNTSTFSNVMVVP